MKPSGRDSEQRILNVRAPTEVHYWAHICAAFRSEQLQEFVVAAVVEKIAATKRQMSRELQAESPPLAVPLGLPGGDEA